jgi:hypothetical protein
MFQGDQDELQANQGRFEPLQLFEKKPKETPQDLSQIETARGQNGVHLVAIGAFEVVAVHPVIFLFMWPITGSMALLLRNQRHSLGLMLLLRRFAK